MNEGKLVFIGDVHLDRDDPDREAFLAFLTRLGRTSRRIVFMGDLFNLWIGRPELEQPHQKAVADKLSELRRGGVVVRYLEGNRDYRIGPCYTGTALDDATAGGITERFGGRSIWAIHGDLANPRDWQYRTWRRFSRSGPVWGLFNLVPRARRLSLAESMESGLRKSNREFKTHFPEQEVRAYAQGFLARGHDAVVLGHFHVEKDLAAGPPGPEGRILVLPEWKSSRRHLEVDGQGEIRFLDSESV